MVSGLIALLLIAKLPFVPPFDWVVEKAEVETAEGGMGPGEASSVNGSSSQASLSTLKRTPACSAAASKVKDRREYEC